MFSESVGSAVSILVVIETLPLHFHAFVLLGKAEIVSLYGLI